MKGTVVSSWIKSCRGLFGDDVVNKALNAFNMPEDKIFTPFEDVDDGIAMGLVDNIGKSMNKSHGEIWGLMGEENIKTFSTNYLGFFRHGSAYGFLKSMNDVHVIVMRRIKGAVPPILDMQPLSSHTALFIYRSKRKMGDYLAGLLKGVGKYFNEDIKVEIKENKESEIHLLLTFEKEITNFKKFGINRLLSLGFIKKTAIKSGLISAVIAGISTALLFAAPVRSLVLAVIVFVAVCGSNSLLQSPLALVLEELKKISQRRFDSRTKVTNADEYMEVLGEIADIRDTIGKDFIDFNGMVDEMYMFNSSLSGISHTMKDTSIDIRQALEQVADAAIKQAADTEHLVGVLNGSIENIMEIAKESEGNNSDIEKAVTDIDASFKNVENTAASLHKVMENFGEIKESAGNLLNRTDEITEIVAIVSGIARQINMLALNASIEASRAGEAGKGFSVVAEEVRRLSVETNQAVDEINGSLTSFAESAREVASGIDIQYGVLEGENRSLTKAVDTSHASNSNLKGVSVLLVETAKHLSGEAETLSSLFENINRLMDITEENTASTQEASASVSMYVEQISALSNQIEVFDALIHNFQTALQEYKI